MLNAGIVRATSSAAVRPPHSSGRRVTRSTIRDHRPKRVARVRSRPSPGIRPRSTLVPSRDISAGSTVSEASIDTATTMIVPVAKDAKSGTPPRYMPAIAIITVMPETSTARPEVAAAMSTASATLRPASRSSRARRR